MFFTFFALQAKSTTASRKNCAMLAFLCVSVRCRTVVPLGLSVKVDNALVGDKNSKEKKRNKISYLLLAMCDCMEMQ